MLFKLGRMEVPFLGVSLGIEGDIATEEDMR